MRLTAVSLSRCHAKKRGMLLLAAPLAWLFSGCGGGGSTSAPVRATAPVTAATAAPFVPNYAPSLRTLRSWPKQDLTVYIGPSLAAPHKSDRVIQGVALWATAAEGRLRFHFTQDRGDEARADITVQFVPRGLLGGRIVGRTSTHYNNPGVITRADILIDEGLDGDVLVDVAAHEIGHALGIDGHSPTPNDLMYSLSTPPALLSSADINTLKSAYDWLFAPDIPAPSVGRSEETLHIITITCPGS